MKKTILFLLLLSGGFYVSAQNLTYTISEFTNDLNASYLTGDADDSYYYLIRLQKVNKKESVAFLDIIEKESLKLKASSEIDVPANATDIKLKDFKTKGDFLFVFFNFESTSNKQNHAVAYIYNKDGKSIGKGIELGSVAPKSTSFKGFNYVTSDVHFNPVTMKYSFLTFKNTIIHDYASGEISEQEAKLCILNKDGNVEIEKKLTFDFYGAAMLKQTSDENGNIYVLLKGLSNYSATALRIKKDVIYPTTIAVFSSSTGNISYIRSNVEESKKIELMQLDFYKGHEGNIFLAGLYQGPRDADEHVRGIYAAAIDIKNLKMLSERSSAFTVHPDNKKKEDFEIGIYSIQNVHICSDNSIKFILGNNYIEDGGLFKSGKVLEVKTNSSFQIVSMTYGVHGQGVYIFDEEFAFTTELSTDNDSYFLYNETDENLAKDDLNKIKNFNVEELLNNAKPSYTLINKSGTAIRKKFIPKVKQHNQVLILTNQAVRSGNSEMIVPIRLSDKISLMRIIAE